MQQPITMTVAFDDADGEGIVFFGNYFRLAHRALEIYLPQIGIPWQIWFANSAWGVPLRKVECEYFSPLRPGQSFLAHILISKLSESTVTFSIEFTVDQKSVAKLATTHVFVDRKAIKKMTIPTDIKKLLQAQQA